MKKAVMKSIALLATASAFSFISAGIARADDPLKYPPFNWNFSDGPVQIGKVADKPADAGKGKKGAKSNNGPQTDFAQGKDKSKQWYDGDFNGLDDD